MLTRGEPSSGESIGARGACLGCKDGGHLGSG